MTSAGVGARRGAAMPLVGRRPLAAFPPFLAGAPAGRRRSAADAGPRPVAPAPCGRLVSVLSANCSTMPRIWSAWLFSSAAVAADSSEFAAACWVTPFICSTAVVICSTPVRCWSLAAAISVITVPTFTISR